MRQGSPIPFTPFKTTEPKRFLIGVAGLCLSVVLFITATTLVELRYEFYLQHQHWIQKTEAIGEVWMSYQYAFRWCMGMVLGTSIASVFMLLAGVNYRWHGEPIFWSEILLLERISVTAFLMTLYFSTGTCFLEVSFLNLAGAMIFLLGGYHILRNNPAQQDDHAVYPGTASEGNGAH